MGHHQLRLHDMAHEIMVLADETGTCRQGGYEGGEDKYKKGMLFAIKTVFFITSKYPIQSI